VSQSSDRLKRIVQTVAVALLMAGAVEGMWRAEMLRWADNYVSDRWQYLTEPVSQADLPVVLIAVDDESLIEIDDPMVFWGPHLGHAIDNLRANGSSVVGIDLGFPVSGEDWLHENVFSDELLEAATNIQNAPALDAAIMKTRTWDMPFRATLYQGDVVMVVLVNPKEDREQPCIVPMNEFGKMLPSAQSNMGYANLGEDSDAVIRRFYPIVLPELPGQEVDPSVRKRYACPTLHFSTVLALRHLKHDFEANSWELPKRTLTRGEHPPIAISYAGPRDTFPSIPFWKVARGELSEQERVMIRDRIAIIGTTYLGAHDLWMSPYDRFHADSRERMPGFEVQANAVTTMVNGLTITEPQPIWRGVLFASMGLFFGLVFSFASMRPSALIALLQAGAWPIAGFGIYSEYQLVLPTASMGFLGLAAFGAVYAVRFAGEERERQFLRQVFSRYVSDEVVGEILNSPQGLGLGGVSREITILFSDIRNFTTISEKLEPEEVVEMLNEYFSRACPHILENRGRVDKFIGDAVMAVFGAPVYQEDHARQALRAAMGMSKECDAFKSWMRERFPDRDLPEFDIGVGIHTGPAVAGNIGFERVTEYAVIGDAVNTASRLEGLTKKLGVRMVLSRQTLLAAGRGIHTGESIEVSVKGRAEPVEVLEFISMNTMTLEMDRPLLTDPGSDEPPPDA